MAGGSQDEAALRNNPLPTWRLPLGAVAMYIGTNGIDFPKPACVFAVRRFATSVPGRWQKERNRPETS